MAKVKEKLKELALTLGAVWLLIFSSIIGVGGGVYAAAETEENDSAIMRELSGLTIDDVKFDAADYPANAEGKPALLHLNELGYGYTAAKQVAFVLILYIYNPAQLNIVQDARNAVQMKIGNAERYTKYALNVIEGSADKLFYKLGVSFKDEEKSAALSSLDKDSRRYEVSSVEFYVEGFNATDYPISRTFTYTGYAAGLGEGDESTLTSTLSYTEAGGTVPIPLSVNHTSWRPEGTNGNSEYTQDTIHSVYFAVPKEYDEQYDYLKSVKATWQKARTTPIFVTGDKEAYDSLKDLQKKNADMVQRAPAPKKFAFSGDGWEYDWAFGANVNIMGDFLDVGDGFGFNEAKWHYRYYTRDYMISVINPIPALYLTKYTGGTAANEYVVSSSEFTDLIRDEAQNGYFANDKKVADKYPSHLFESFDESKTTKVIEKDKTDKELILHSEKVRQDWWGRLFGLVENKKDYEGIQAIQKITDEDNVENKTPKELCDSLYISERDAIAFSTFYGENKNDSTVYLMRFAISEYKAMPTRIYHVNKYAGIWAYDERNKNGYLAQTDCFLDFDVIDFEYVKEDKSYVIPVSMSPIDVFPEITPPPKYGEEFWKYGVAIMAGLTAAYVVYRIALKIARS